MDFFIKPAYASCPVCVITVGGGLLLAKKLGIDDLLVSIWISGLNTAIAFWFASTMKKKVLNNPFIWTVIMFVATIWYLWFSKQLFHPTNTFLGMDKVLFGMIVGLFVFLFSVGLDRYFRKINKGKVLFYYQKVIIPVFLLTITTLFFKVFLLR